MTSRLDELTITILRIIAEGNLGTDATGHFAKLDDIIEEIGDKNDTKNIIKNLLLPKKYIRKINDKFESVHGHELEYTAYQITQLGKTYLNSHNTAAHQRDFAKVTESNLLTRNQPDNRVIDRLNQLIAQADDVLATHTPNPPGYVGFSTLDAGKFQQWKVSSENIIKAICGPDSNYLENFKKETKRGGHVSCVKAGKGILLALKDDVDAGLYESFRSTPPTYDVSAATIKSDTVNLKINSMVYKHIKQYLDSEDYFHAVEEAYKVVREKLREITGKEAATDIFNMNAENDKYHEQIFGEKAVPGTPQHDFYRGVGYLNLAIQFLRNEKSHSLATTLEKDLAIHYISLASLAYDLISKGNKR